MDKVLYVVSGFMRTGTSMMMKSLEAGGLDAAYQQSRDVMKDRYADEQYDPNLGGLYELGPRDYRNPKFPQAWEGRLIKALNHAIPRMAEMPGGIRAVFMRRNPEEIRQSFLGFFNHNMNLINFDERMQTIVRLIKQRSDVLSCDVFWFREVCESPLEHFEILKQSGWPIDVERAAAVVNPNLCRYKIENLTVGVV